MAKYNSEPEIVAAINIIGNGTVINGEINCNGDIRIDGTLKGNLLAKGKLVIGETGKITGEVVCKNADILGVFEGKLFVSELLTFKSTANVKGDIVTNKMAIEPNCKFTGTCKMDDETLRDVQQKIEKPEPEA
jgi:cytoskeletal protein CcmA (bactofilin family)